MISVFYIVGSHCQFTVLVDNDGSCGTALSIYISDYDKYDKQPMGWQNIYRRRMTYKPSKLGQSDLVFRSSSAGLQVS